MYMDPYLTPYMDLVPTTYSYIYTGQGGEALIYYVLVPSATARIYDH